MESLKFYSQGRKKEKCDPEALHSLSWKACDT